MSGPVISRRAWAEIDLGALRHNLGRVRAHAPDACILAAIKADGYGHGALRVAQSLEQANGFAVASLAEALQLRWGGIRKQPIVVLSEPLTAAALATCSEQGLQPLLFDHSQMPALREYAGPPVKAWIKLDTGMHRLGFAAARAADLFDQIQAAPAVGLAGWMTHLASADNVSDESTPRQVRLFDQVLTGLPGPRSIANSAGVLAWPETHTDWVRPGIMLYGASPLLDRTAEALGLRPAMTLRAPLISVRELAAGEPVGYGADWHAQQATRIGVIGIGYGDGYPRHLPNGTPVLLGDHRVPLVGRVSMDMITVDLADCPRAAVGDEAVLWGRGLPADEIAAAAGTIAYELFCQLTARVDFKYCN